MKRFEGAYRRALVVVAVFIGAVVASGGFAAQTQEPAAAMRSYAVPGHGRLGLTVPKAWREKVEQPAGNLPPTITFTPQQGEDFTITVTPTWSPDGTRWVDQHRKLRELVRANEQKALANAVETEVKLEEIVGKNAFGYLTYPLTDKGLVGKTLAPGTYLYLAQGAMGVGDLLVVVTVLFQDKDAGVRDAAVKMLKSAAQTQGSADASLPLQDSPNSAPKIVRNGGKIDGT
jgi:hypothetical protein